MKTFLEYAMGGSLIIGLFVLAAPNHAFAAAPPGPSTTGLCVALDDTCAAIDSNFKPTAASASVKGAVTSTTCSGTTTKLPTKALKCDGETLGGASGETAPTQACVMTLGGTSQSTDDWSETISTKGKVTLVCKFGGSDTK
jgi:hypothetical protein